RAGKRRRGQPAGGPRRTRRAGRPGARRPRPPGGGGDPDAGRARTARAHRRPPAAVRGVVAGAAVGRATPAPGRPAADPAGRVDLAGEPPADRAQRPVRPPAGHHRRATAHAVASTSAMTPLATAVMPAAPPRYATSNRERLNHSSGVSRTWSVTSRPSSATTEAASVTATRASSAMRLGVAAGGSCQPEPDDTRRPEPDGSGPGPAGVAGGSPPAATSTSPATAAHAPTTSSAATASLGRCHPAESVATPVSAASPVPASAATPRRLPGNTRTSAAATEAVTVVCPLGRLLPTAARARSTPNSGRWASALSTCVVTLAATTIPVATAASRNRRRSTAMIPMATVANATDSTETVSSTAATRPATRSCTTSPPASATVSSCWPRTVPTKTRRTASTPNDSATTATTSHATVARREAVTMSPRAGATRSYRKIIGRQQVAQAVSGKVELGVHTAAPRRQHVRLIVVDKQDLRGRRGEGGQGGLEERRIRLGDAQFGGV